MAVLWFAQHQTGGAILIQGGRVELRHCIFEGNVANVLEEASQRYLWGGAIAVLDRSTLVVHSQDALNTAG